MDIDPAKHCSPDNLNGSRLSDACSMIIDKIPLKILYLVIIKCYFRELTDAGVYSIHNFMGNNFLFEHCTAFIYPVPGPGMKFHLLTMTGNIHYIVYSQTIAGYNKFFHKNYFEIILI